MATVDRVGMGPIMTIIMAITVVSGRRMFMYSGITRMAGTIMILAIEGSRAVRLGVGFMVVADSVEVADSTVGAVVTAAAMADDGKWTTL